MFSAPFPMGTHGGVSLGMIKKGELFMFVQMLLQSIWVSQLHDGEGSDLYNRKGYVISTYPFILLFFQSDVLLELKK